MNSPDSQQQTDRVVDRLRQLESRLTLLSGTASFKTEEIDSALVNREQARARFYAEAVRQGSTFALELTKSIDASVSQRMNQVADRAMAKLDFTLASLEVASVEHRLSEQEQRVPKMMEQFSELRQSAFRLEERLAEAGANLDIVWKQQESTGIGGWRLVMRAVSAQVELEKQRKPAVANSFRTNAEAAETIPPAVANIVCPKCNQITLRRVGRETLLEEVLRIAFVAPYRCENCGMRSYHFRYTLTATR